MTTKEVSEKYQVCTTACANWARKNGVRRIAVQGILAYDWTEDDCIRFEQRRGKGWKKGVKRKRNGSGT